MQRGRLRLVVALLCAFAVHPAIGQGDPSHRELQRPGSGMLDLRSLQKRLELMQHLQRLAKMRQEKGQPPFDISKLSPDARKKLSEVLKQDKDQRKKVEALKRMIDQRSNTNPPFNQPPSIPREGSSTRRQSQPRPPQSSQRNGFTPGTQRSPSRNQFNGGASTRNQPRSSNPTQPGNRRMLEPASRWPSRNASPDSNQRRAGSSPRTRPNSSSKPTGEYVPPTSNSRTSDPGRQRTIAPRDSNSRDRQSPARFEPDTSTPPDNKPRSTSYFKKLREFSERNAYKKPKQNTDADLIRQLPPDFFKQLEELDQSRIQQELRRGNNSRNQQWPDTRSQRDLVDDAAGNFDMLSRWAKQMQREGVRGNSNQRGNPTNGTTRNNNNASRNGTRRQGNGNRDNNDLGDLGQLLNRERRNTDTGPARTRIGGSSGNLSRSGSDASNNSSRRDFDGQRSGASRGSFTKLLKDIEKTAKDAARTRDGNGRDTVTSGSRNRSTQANRTGKSGSSSSSSSSSSLNDVVKRAAEHVSDDVITDLVKGAQKSRSRSQQTRSGSNWQPQQRSRPQKFFRKLFDGGRKVSKYFDGDSGSTSSGRGMNGFSGPGNVSLPNAPSASAFLPLLIAVGVIGLLWVLLRTVNAPQPAAVAVGAIEAEMPLSVNSRQDVIDAFHAIAARTPAVRGNWWTHSRVGRALRKLMPSRDDAVSRLTDVYETARYLPPDQELTSEQLQIAREAVQQCRP